MKEQIAHSQEACKVHNETQLNKLSNLTSSKPSESNKSLSEGASNKSGNGSLDDPIEQEQLKSLVDHEL